MTTALIVLLTVLAVGGWATAFSLGRAGARKDLRLHRAMILAARGRDAFLEALDGIEMKPDATPDAARGLMNVGCHFNDIEREARKGLDDAPVTDQSFAKGRR